MKSNCRHHQLSVRRTEFFGVELQFNVLCLHAVQRRSKFRNTKRDKMTKTEGSESTFCSAVGK